MPLQSKERLFTLALAVVDAYGSKAKREHVYRLIERMFFYTRFDSAEAYVEAARREAIGMRVAEERASE